MASDLDVDRVESILGYIFRDKDLLKVALTTPHKNKLEEGGMEGRDGNRRLTLVGDAVLKLILIEEWYDSGRDQGLPPLITHSMES